jgi:hypothetical protein
MLIISTYSYIFHTYSYIFIHIHTYSYIFIHIPYSDRNIIHLNMRLAGDGHGDTASGALDADTESLPKVSRISSDNW